MYSIRKNQILLTRGDTLKVKVNMTLNGEDYIPQSGDSIRFAMKKNYADGTPLILKDIPIDTQILQLDPEDTKPFPFGQYVFDIEITFADGTVDTFILGTIKLTEEVY